MQQEIRKMLREDSKSLSAKRETQRGRKVPNRQEQAKSRPEPVTSSVSQPPTDVMKKSPSVQSEAGPLFCLNWGSCFGLGLFKVTF